MKPETSQAGEIAKQFGSVEVSGQNGTLQAAIDTALDLASKQQGKQNLRWFEVTSIRGALSKDGITLYQATLKVGYEVPIK